MRQVATEPLMWGVEEKTVLTELKTAQLERWRTEWESKVKHRVFAR